MTDRLLNQKSEISPSRASGSNENQKSILVLGGGLAGIATAVRLTEQGFVVTLIETRQRLGGRATSFTDPATGALLDNCQHVLLGCCTNLLDLYGRLGVADRIEWHRKYYFADSHGNLDELEAGAGPAPLHLSVVRFKGLSWPEKLAIAQAMWAMMRLSESDRDSLHQITFTRWLSDQSQPEGAVRKFWSPIVTGAINELPDRMAADYAIHVFQEGFLAHSDAYVMGLPGVPLVELYDAATQRGGKVMLSRSVEKLNFADGRVTGVELDGGERLSADIIVSALPFDRLAKISPPELVATDARLARLSEFEVSPILGIHMFFAVVGGRPVMNLPHLVLTESPLQWIFNKGVSSQETGDRSEEGRPVQHLHGVVDAAHDLVDEPADKIIEMAEAEVRKALAPLGGNASARLVHAKVIKEKRATFSARPGVNELRPVARGAVPNFYLAGDWCATGWPATMEGAVRSGYLAAQALVRDATGTDFNALAQDSPPSALNRWLGG